MVDSFFPPQTQIGVHPDEGDKHQVKKHKGQSTLGMFVIVASPQSRSHLPTCAFPWLVSIPYHDIAGRTTSTEQCARAATAAETLPSKNCSTRLWPRAPF